MVLAILVLSAIGFGIYFLWRKPESKPNFETASPIANLLRQEQLEKLNQDSDGDGLKDWEEAIFRTDLNNSDTDGDGTKDGEEIKLARDPLKKGPNDGVATSTLLENYSPYFSPDNLTGQLAEKFGVNIIVPRLSGSSRPLDFEGIGNQIISETLSGTASRQNYFTEKDVKVSGDNSIKAVGDYAKDIIGATTVFSAITSSPLEIFADALSRDDFSSLETLDSYLIAYDKMLDRLKNISTPSKLSSFHLRYMNLVQSQKDAVGKIRNAEMDIVGAIVGAQEFAANFNEIRSLMENLTYVPSQ
mgnify:CR=1 FL=1